MASREERPTRVTELLIALSLLAVVVVLAGTVALLLRSVNDRPADSIPGPTAVYIPGGEGSEGVPTYEVAGRQQQGLLPNFTLVEMICWEDAEGRRWFRVLPISQEAPGVTVIVQAAHTHNQTRVDSC